MILPTFWLTLAPINAGVGIFTGLLATSIAIWLMVANSPVIEVSGDELRVSNARIELKFIGSVRKIEKSEQFAERGPKLDSRAYLALQATANGLIKVSIKDDRDPTPYWLFSTNRPDELVSVLVGKAKPKA